MDEDFQLRIDTAPLIDPSYLQGLKGALGMPKLDKLLGSVEPSLRGMCHQVLQSVTGNPDDTQTMLVQAHNLKGASGHVGLIALHLLSDAIVDHLRAGQWIRAASLCAQLDAMLDRSVSEMNALWQKMLVE